MQTSCQALYWIVDVWTLQGGFKERPENRFQVAGAMAAGRGETEPSCIDRGEGGLAYRLHESNLPLWADLFG